MQLSKTFGEYYTFPEQLRELSSGHLILSLLEERMNLEKDWRKSLFTVIFP
jgi:hypothetical protein